MDGDGCCYGRYQSLGGWDAVIEKHFSDGGIFDTIYERNR